VPRGQPDLADDVEAAGLDLDRPSVSVLLTLNMADGPLRVGEIAQRVQTAGPHATRLVKELEWRRLVHRVTDPHDRRASLIELTEPGASAVTTYVRTLFGWFAEAVTDWDERDRRHFGRRLPTRFVDDLTARLTAADAEEPGGRADGAGAVTTAGARVRGPGPADHRRPSGGRGTRPAAPPGRPMHTAPGACAPSAPPHLYDEPRTPHASEGETTAMSGEPPSRTPWCAARTGI